MLIPIHRPPHSLREIRLAISLVQAHGPRIRPIFEEAVTGWLGTRQFLTTGSGRRALFLGMKLLDIGPGDEVIYPAYTPAIVPLVIRATGADPVPCDVTAQDWTLDPDAVLSRITDRTRAILPVHVYGYPPDLPGLDAICRRYGLLLVENAANAFGATCAGRQAATWGDMGIFSFGLGKSLSLGGGGGLVVRDPDLFERAAGEAVPEESRSSVSLLGSLLASLGLSHPAVYGLLGLRFKTRRVSREYRGYDRDLSDRRDPSPLAFALGITGLRSQPWRNRILNAGYYRELFRDLPNIRLQEVREGIAPVFTRFFVQTRSPAAQEAARRALFREGIEPSIPDDHPFTLPRSSGDTGDLPVSRSLAGTLVGIPVYTRIPDETLRRIFTGI
jgi:dTDP-4-amino-4,6-dideoxygalactose transaminase